MSPLILLVGLLFAGGMVAASKPSGKGKHRRLSRKLSDKSKKLLAKSTVGLFKVFGEKVLGDSKVGTSQAHISELGLGTVPIVSMTDFPKPYDYASVLAVCNKLLPTEFAGTSDVMGVYEADASLAHNLFVNKKAAETSDEPKWVRVTQLVYSVLIPFLASGLGWRTVRDFPYNPGRAEANASQLAGYALYVAMFFVGPATSMIPKNVSIADVYANPDLSKFAYEAEFFKKPTVDEQFEALFDLHWVLRTMGSVWTRQAPIAGFNGCDQEELCEWLPAQQAAGAARVVAIKGRFFGPIATPGHVVEGSVELAAEIARYSVETAYLLAAMRLSELREAKPVNVGAIIVGVGAAVVAIAFAIMIPAIAAGVAPAVAALTAGTVVGTAYAEASAFIASAIVAAEGLLTSVVGAEAAGLIISGIVLAAQAAIVAAMIDVVLDLGLDELIKELGWEDAFSSLGLGDFDVPDQSAAAFGQAGKAAAGHALGTSVLDVQAKTFI